MAREIITKIWCDVCMEEDMTYVDAVETPPIVIGNLKPRVLALCEVHTKEVFDPIKQILTELGQVLPEQANANLRKPSMSGKGNYYPCPDPACHKNRKPFKHAQSLRNHANQVHAMPIAELREKHGLSAEPDQALFEDEVPDGGEVIEAAAKPPAVTEAKCDQPGCTTAYSWPETARPTTALGVHKARHHGIKSSKKKQAVSA